VIERVSIRLYAAAFVLMLSAGVVLAIAGLGALSSLGLLWLSAGLSAGAVVAATASIVVSRR
jgi:hypothetical protein